MIVLGIDLGIGKIACAIYDLDAEIKLLNAHWLVTASVDTPTSALARAKQLSELKEYVYQLAVAYAADHVFVEQVIIGNNRKYSLQLAQTLGAVLCGLAPGAETRGMGIHLVDNKAWKKRLLGNGNADKDAIRTYIDTTHPAYALLCDGDQDRYDACCVGLYGLDVLAQSKDLKLSG